MLDGILFLHILNRSHPDLKKAVIPANATEEKRSAGLAEGAELFIEKPRTPEGLKSIFIMLEELITWTPQAGFQGVLRRVGLQDVIQMACLGRTSSILEIHNLQLRGWVYIEDGRIIHAEAGDLAGEAAFYKLLALASGEFQLQPFESPSKRTIEGQWGFMLMEAARVQDETAAAAAAARAAPPSEPAPVVESRRLTALSRKCELWCRPSKPRAQRENTTLLGTDAGQTPPGPVLPPDVVAKTSAKYLEAYERLTGKKL